MSIRRYLPRTALTVVSAVGYPSLLVLITAGITFTAVEVFAESGPGAPSCSDERISSCADAAIYSACSCASGNCGCFPTSCLGDAGTFQPTVACLEPTLCSHETFGFCTGKAEGSACEFFGSPGVCVPHVCADRAGDLYTPQTRSRCIYQGLAAPSPDAGRPPDPTPTDGAPDAATNATAAPSDSGCSTAPPTSRGLLALALLPAGLIALAWRARRRRSTHG